MAIRCYIPTTLRALAAGPASGVAVAPDAHGRGLRGEEGEAWEFDAMCIAAAIAATEALRPGPAADLSPRAVLAYDAPDSAPWERLTEGFDLLRLDTIDPAGRVSIHVDEPEVWTEAVALVATAGQEAAEDRLGASDLLWYDITELPDLLEG